MPDVEVGDVRAGTNGISRRRFIGYLIAAPTLVAAADLRTAPTARASVPTAQPVDFYDLTDLLTDAANLTASLITVTINSDGTASFALPRAEVGQGIATAIAMVIADELELPLDKVNITLSAARPELEFNQLTGGSNSVHSLYDQVRVASAIARGQWHRRRPSNSRRLCPSWRSKMAWSRPRRNVALVRLARRPGGGLAHAGGTRAAEARFATDAGRHPAAANRRRADRDRHEAVRDGSRRGTRASDDGLPSADDQRECAGRPERDAGQGDGWSHRRRDHPAHSVRPRRCGGSRHHVRAVHRRGSRAPGPMGTRSRGRQVRCRRPPGSDQRRTTDDAWVGTDARSALHVFLPSRGSVGDQLRRCRRPSWQRRDLVGDEVADLLPGDGGPDPGTARIGRDGTRDPRRRFVRAPPVRGRGVRGGGDLEGDWEASQADVAPDGTTFARDACTRCPPRGSGSPIWEQRDDVRPAPYECRDGLHARAGRDPERNARRPSRGRLSRLFPECVHFHGQRPLQLRDGYTAAQRGLPPTGKRVQHIERAQHLQPGGDRGQGADGRPGGQRDAAGSVPVPPVVRARRSNAGGAGGAGEFGVAASMAAVANAYARATGTMPTSFPINHNQPLGFTPLPTVPPIPESPTDGLQEAF